MKEEIKKIVEKALRQAQGVAVGRDNLDFSVDVADNKSHGDYSTNVALILAKKMGKNPREVAESILEKIRKDSIFAKIEIAGPGFINFFISEKYLQKKVAEIIKQGERFGNLKIGGSNGCPKKINVEFISANPTGPLTLGNGRGGFGGDVLSNILEKAGYKVTREYYINDTGNQINKLGHSVLKDAEAVYRGEYIDELNKKIKGKTPEEVGAKAGKEILEKMIKPSVKKMGIKFDKWFSETTLYKNKEVDEAINEIKKKGFTYESEGALWFKSKELGDDKDRVLIRSDGIKTYFSSDIAYLRNKFERGYDRLIIFLGADHYGYVARLKAGCHALGYSAEGGSASGGKKGSINAIVLQLVRLFENGKEVRMSKRTGIYVTINELIDEVGLDVARFFFLQRSLNTHFNFDMDLAKKKSDENPVFKIQYAYARINSIFKKAKRSGSKPKNLEFLKEPDELGLIKQMIKFPEIIQDTASDYQLQRLPNYALELAESFHRFYESCKVISEDKKLTDARLSLLLATKIVLKNVLELMGISTPEKMNKNEIK